MQLNHAAGRRWHALGIIGVQSVATTPGGTPPPPLLQMTGHGGHRGRKQETDQTVLAITKASKKRLVVLLEPASGGA